ncbi:MAG: hypothetical protein ACLF0P_00180 [Thermoanaerobaculia bacterium]
MNGENGRFRRAGSLAALALLAAVPALALPGGVPELFATADACASCHDQLVTPEGEDISIAASWRGSMMANSARDPYWQAAVRREVLDHPESAAAIENECAACHMPMTTTQARAAGGQGSVFDHLPATTAPGGPGALAADGVSCTVCHQITAEGLGTKESFTGGFVVDTTRPAGEREIFGPFEVDAGRARIMSSASGYEPRKAEHLASSELCATCHTLYTHSLGPGGEVIGELPEQVPYLEWRESDYARAGRECIDCHMPEVAGEVPVTGVLGQPRPAVSRHVFRGGNVLVPRMLNRFAGELGVTAAPEELDATLRRTREFLETSTARLRLERLERTGDRLEVEIAVENLAGHKLPTAYPSRRAWLHVSVRDAGGRVVFESGALEPSGAIRGNDNDRDPARYEPHYQVIERPDQVQIYEPILVDPDERVTTGLLTAVGYGKDNRLLPRGFDPATAPEDVAVQGRAAEDGDFAGGGDRVRYVVDLAGAPEPAAEPLRGPLTVEAELWYQPIGYRWARNLEPYDAPETRRFVRYFDEMSSVSGVVLARVRASTGDGGP